MIVALLVLRLPSVGTRLANLLLGRISLGPEAALSVAEFRGDWITRLEFLDLRAVRRDTVVAAVDTLRVRLRPGELLRGRVVVSRLELLGPRVSADFAAGPPDSSGDASTPGLTEILQGRFYNGPPLRVERIVLRGGAFGYAAGPGGHGPRIADVDLIGRDLELGGEFTVAIDSLALALHPSGWEAGSVDLLLTAVLSGDSLRLDRLQVAGPASSVSATGAVSFGESGSIQFIAIELYANPLNINDLDPFLPGRDLEWAVTAAIRVHGPRHDLLSGSVHADASLLRLGDLQVVSPSVSAEIDKGRAELEVEATFEGAQIGIRGWVEPLGRPPRHDLTLLVDRMPRRLPSAPWWEALARRGTVAGRLHVWGEGFGPAEVNVQGELTDGMGRVDLDGALRLGPELDWELERLVAENLDVARWVGDTTASRVTGTLRASGRGTDPAAFQAAGAWDLASSQYGMWRVQSGDGRITIDGPRLGTSLRLATDAGRVKVDTATVNLGGKGEFAIPAIRFDSVDLAGVTGSALMESDLNGALSLTGAGFVRPSGSATGPPWGNLSTNGTLVLDPSRLREREIREGEARFELHGGELRLVAAVATDAGRFALETEARPFDSRPRGDVRDLRFADLDLGAWSLTPVATDLNGHLRGEFLAAAKEATESRGASAPPFSGSATLLLAPSVVGSVAVTGAEIEAAFSGDRVDGRGSLQTKAGDATFEADAELGTGGPSGHASVLVPFGLLAALAGRDTLVTSGEVRVEVDAVGDGARPRTVTAVLRGRGQIGDWGVDTLWSEVRLTGGVVAVDTLSLRSTAVTADAAGRVVVSDSLAGETSDLRVDLSVRDPSPLRALLGADTLAVAECRIKAHLTGKPPAHVLTLNGSLRALAWNDLRLLAGGVEARGELRDDWRLSTAGAKANIVRLYSPALSLNGADLSANLDNGEIDFNLTTQMDDTHSAWVSGTARRDTIGVNLELSRAEMQADSVLWRLMRPADLRVGGGRIAIDSLEARTDSGLVLAGGVIDRAGEQDFRLRAENIGLDIVGGWLGRPDLGGRLDARLTLTGPSSRPRAEGALRISTVASGAPAGLVAGQLLWDGRQAEMQASFVSPAGDSLTVIGYLPLALSIALDDTLQRSKAIQVSTGDVNLRISARRFPLSVLTPLLPPETVSTLGGNLESEATLSGQSAQLRGDGYIRIADGVIGVPALGITYRDLQLNGLLEGDRFVLRRADAKSDRGWMRMTGDVRVVGLTEVESNLSMTFTDFLFMDSPDVRVLASGDLNLSGTMTAPEVSGRITASGCSYTLRRTAFTGSQSERQIVLTPEDIRMMEETFGYQAAPSAPPMQGLMDAASVDLDMSLGRDNWVLKRTAPRLAVEITGQIHVQKPAYGDLSLEGRVAPIPGRGYFEQFGRTFDFAGGEVLLNGRMEDHLVDIRTRYKVRSPGASDEPEVIVHLDVQGDMERMQLALSSEPPLSETEIITYITTGRSPIKPEADADKGGSDAAALATDIGLSHLTGSFEEVVQEQVGLDVLQVRYEALHGATLVAGRYVSPVVYLGLQQPLQYRERGGRSSQNPYQTVVELEYEAYTWLILNLQGEASLLRSFLRTSHAY